MENSNLHPLLVAATREEEIELRGLQSGILENLEHIANLNGRRKAIMRDIAERTGMEYDGQQGARRSIWGKREATLCMR